jgi:tRNA modification GTPase
MSVVFALATPPAKSAICVFRVSGDGCLEKLSSLTGSGVEKHRTFYLRNIKNKEGKHIDSVGLVAFKGPDSYTGEDSFEVYAHGSLGVMSLLVDVFKEVGFDEAQPGEFTKRAFLNNKISLAQAEAVVDVVDSYSSEAVYLSSQTLTGGFTKEVVGLSNKIDLLRVGVEGEIDFADEGEAFLDDSILKNFESLVNEFRFFLSGCVNKKMFSGKNKVLFVGPVNSGKSSVFNRLLGFERALVSDVPGTTRDLVESEIFYNETSFSLSDSAGLRETEDKIESRGIELAIDQIQNTDVVVGVFDSSNDSFLESFDSVVGEKKYIKLFNKLDLGSPSNPGDFDCLVSAKTGEGFDKFKSVLSNTFIKSTGNNFNYMIRNRHAALLESSLANLESAFFKLRNNNGLELVAEDLKNARSDLDEVVGIKTSDSLLGDIFSSFCIGK